VGKYVKELLQKELETSFKGVNEFLVVSITGVKGTENNRMRVDLRSKGVKFSVVRNSLIRRALDGLDMAGAKDIFTGPCAVAYGGDSVVDVAKELVNWSKQVPAIELKAAFLDGQILDGRGAEDLSKMPSRAELQGQVVALAQSPGAAVAAAIGSPAGLIAGCIKTLIENKEKQAA